MNLLSLVFVAVLALSGSTQASAETSVPTPTPIVSPALDPEMCEGEFEIFSTLPFIVDEGSDPDGDLDPTIGNTLTWKDGGFTIAIPCGELEGVEFIVLTNSGTHTLRLKPGKTPKKTGRINLISGDTAEALFEAKITNTRFGQNVIVEADVFPSEVNPNSEVQVLHAPYTASGHKIATIADLMKIKGSTWHVTMNDVDVLFADLAPGVLVPERQDVPSELLKGATIDGFIDGLRFVDSLATIVDMLESNSSISLDTLMNLSVRFHDWYLAFEVESQPAQEVFVKANIQRAAILFAQVVPDSVTVQFVTTAGNKEAALQSLHLGFLLDQRWYLECGEGCPYAAFFTADGNMKEAKVRESQWYGRRWAKDAWAMDLIVPAFRRALLEPRPLPTPNS
ncbi:MAG: hypothetical protein AAB367_03470 [Patescibacteria group bacterium]